ncbi:MAG: hypothetical protein LIO53_06575 [Oscillospiraceae bacterium]|nr:hypothetical protein [Oscillospiraceae bacterium]
MTHNSAPYLCGGVFFSLLEPVKYNGTVRQKVNGKYKGVSDPEMMAALINVVTGFVPDSSASGFIKDVSRYRTCSFNGGKNIPFNKADVISAFDYDLKNDYNTLLNRMIDFTDSCILSEVPGRMNWLVKVILELIEKDPSISDEAKFYITADREGTYKSVIKRMSSFELQPFLLGVLHYFITAKKKRKHKGVRYIQSSVSHKR